MSRTTTVHGLLVLFTPLHSTLASVLVRQPMNELYLKE